MQNEHRDESDFPKIKIFCIDKEQLKLYIKLIWYYNLNILFKEVCKFSSSLTLACKKGSQNILERLFYEEKYKLIYYTVLDSVPYQGLLNSFLLNDNLGVKNLHYCSCVYRLFSDSKVLPLLVASKKI